MDLRVCVVIILLYSRRRFDKQHELHTGQNAEPCQGPCAPSNYLAGVGDPGSWVSTVSGRNPGVKSAGADRAIDSQPEPDS